MKNNSIYDLIDLEIPYREELDLASNITFGIEVEFEKLPLNMVEDLFSNSILSKWNIKTDVTVTKKIDEIELGGEISSPIMSDTKTSYQSIKNACNLLKENGAITGDLSGGHIHFGHQILKYNPKYWHNFILLWIAFEKVIMKFSYGKNSFPREALCKYATPTSELFYKNYNIIKKENNMIKLLSILFDCLGFKENSIDFTHITGNDISLKQVGYSTIEFRCPNGTLDPIIWQNNINFFAKLLDYATRKDFESTTIKYVIFKDGPVKNINETTYLYPEEAKILSDLIFSNELDKLYFLKQYYKAYDEKSLNDELVRSREIKR